MSMRGAVAGCVVLVCLVALLAERTEGHITFFSPKEMMLMKQEREGKKDFDTRQLDNPTGITPLEPPEELPTSPVETVGSFHQSLPGNADQVVSEVEEFLHELAKEHRRAK